MQKPLLGKKIAVLVANGFCEQDMTQAQSALQKLGAHIRVVSMDHGLVSSWNGTGWGLHFASDQVLNTALAADYEMLIIPGGQRSIDKLKLTAHTRRFIGGFLDAQKPVAVFDEALDLVAFAEKIVGRTVTGPENVKNDSVKAGAIWSENNSVIDGNLISGGASRGERAEYIKAVSEFFASDLPMSEAA